MSLWGPGYFSNRSDGPRDVSGQNDGASSATVFVAGDVSKEYVDTRDELRVLKSGDTMTGDLAMGGHRLKGLSTGLPGSNSDATSWIQAVNLVTDATTNNARVPAGPLYLTNKRYVDAQDTLRMLKAGDTMTGDLRLSVGEDTGRLLGCTDLAVGKRFTIPLGRGDNCLWYDHQALPTPVTLDTTGGFLVRTAGGDVCRFHPSHIEINKDINAGGHSIIMLKPPTNPRDAATKVYVDGQDALRMLKNGDTMTGDLLVSLGEDEERILGCTDLRAGKKFALILGNAENRLRFTGPSASQVSPPVFLDTAGGFQIRVGNSDLFYFGASGARFTTDIGMSGHNIGGLQDPVASQDAATKAYVDSSVSANYLSYDGHIPPMSSNTSQAGFTAVASSTKASTHGSAFQPFMAFSPHLSPTAYRNSWVAAVPGAGSWLQIRCPAAVRIWKIRLRGRATRITRWNFLGSNDELTFTRLLTSDVALTTTAQEFLVNIPAGVSYAIYRLEVLAAEPPENPGISHFQIFTRNI